MAHTPSFVVASTELDVGQKGSTRYDAVTARYPCKVVMGPPTLARVENELPQQATSFVDHLGFTEQLISWQGTVRTTTDTIMAAIESDLSRFTTGQTITDGVRSAPDADFMVPGTLKNASSRVLSTKAVLQPAEWGETYSLQGGTFAYARRLILRFKILA